jgi:hypothetical protein
MDNQAAKIVKIAVVGSRTFCDWALAYRRIGMVLVDLKSKFGQDTKFVFVCGMADGADTIGEMYAYQMNHERAWFEPNWKKYGKRGGIVRNQAMADFADVVIALGDTKSGGTGDMVVRSRKKKLIVYEYNSPVPGTTSVYRRTYKNILDKERSRAMV